MNVDCKPEDAFWTNNSTVIRNIFQLVETIDAMDDYTFRYHINSDHNKNDFADWIRDVIGDEELAMQLEGILDRVEYSKIIRKRIQTLQELPD